MKIITFYIKNGTTVEFKKENIAKNLLWKFVFPLKYYFASYRNKVMRKKQKELESISSKWKIKNVKK